MKNLAKVIFIVSISICFTNNIFSQNANDALRLSESGILSGARSLGMGNAYTSLSNDISASIFNPAGFGLIKKFEIEGGFDLNSYENDVTFFNRSINSSSNKTNLSQLGAVFPVPTAQGSLVFAFGFSQLNNFNRTVQFDGYNPNNNSYIQDLYNYGNSSELDFLYNLGLIYTDANNKDQTNIAGKLNQKGSTLQEGRINSWYISGAVEVEENIFIGATIDLISGTYKNTKDYWEEDKKDNYPASVQLDPNDVRTADFQAFNLYSITDWDISGWDAKLGVLAKLNKSFNVGATIRFPRTFTIKETYSCEGLSYFLNKTFDEWLADDQIEYDITTPYEFTLGASYSQPFFTVSADAKIVDYSTMEFTDGFTAYNRADENNYIKNTFRSVVNLHGGIEFLVPNTGLALRAGAMLIPSAYKDDPSEFDKKYITAGIGYRTGKNLTINFAYAYGWWKDYGDNYDANLSRTYQDINTQDFVISLKYSL